MKNLEISQMENLQGGYEAADWRCYVGSAGSAILGGATAGPWGFIGGALVGAATFC